MVYYLNEAENSKDTRRAQSIKFKINEVPLPVTTPKYRHTRCCFKKNVLSMEDHICRLVFYV